MRLHILGSNGTYPTPGRPGSGFVVEHRSTVVWLDAGPGTFTALWDRFELAAVSAVIVSHEHPDHCTDLLSAYHALSYGPQTRPPLPLYCPQAVVSRLREFVQAGESHAIDRAFDFRPMVDGDYAAVGEISVLFAGTDHSVPTLGSRIEADGKVLAYSADTGPDGRWRALADTADLFVCEATYQGDPGRQPYTQHLTAGQAGQIARDRGAKRLMLTHIPAHLDSSTSVYEAEFAFDRSVALAVPGTVHDI